jgi:hypothetical protein
MNSPTSLRTRELRSHRDATSLVVFAVVFANAATQFAIQAWMTFRFATDVWRIPEPLCVALIFALDLFAVMFMVFTYLLRDVRLRTKFYVWSVFAVGVGAQLFAAELYGAHQSWELPVRIFAGLPSLFLAASLHGLIIWRRHRAGTKPAEPRLHPDFIRCPLCGGDAISRDVLRAHMARRHPAPGPVQTRSIKTIEAQSTAPVKPVPPLVSSGAAPRKRGGRRNGPSDQAKQDAIYSVLARSETAAQAASRLGVSKRAVELWVQHARAAGAGQQFSDALTTMLPTSPQVNGHRPEVGATP